MYTSFLSPSFPSLPTPFLLPFPSSLFLSPLFILPFPSFPFLSPPIPLSFPLPFSFIYPPFPFPFFSHSPFFSLPFSLYLSSLPIRFKDLGTLKRNCFYKNIFLNFRAITYQQLDWKVWYWVIHEKKRLRLIKRDWQPIFKKPSTKHDSWEPTIGQKDSL